MTPSLIKEKCLVKIAYSKSVLTTQIIRFCFFKKDIPGYFFKDDALQLEGAIRRFVHQYVTHYYKSTQILLRFRLWVCWSNAMSVFQAAYFWNIFSNAEVLSTNNLKYIFFNEDDDRIVKEDEEIQGFYQELTAERAMDGSRGCGMNVCYLYTLILD